MTRDPKTSTEPLGFTRFALLLHTIPHIGEKTLTRLLHHVSSRRIEPETCLQWSVEEWQTRCELDPRAAATLCEQQDALLSRAEEMARTVRQHSLHVLTPQSPAYPDRLERFDDSPPPIVYALGNLGLLLPLPALPEFVLRLPRLLPPRPKQNRLRSIRTNADNSEQTATAKTPAASTRAPFTFSIAVSNGADNATLKRMEAMATVLVQRGCVPVTGHDRTPYKRLALAAQRQNRPVIYVMDRGLRDAIGAGF